MKELIPADNRALEELFSDLGIEIVSEPLFDYGKLYSREDPYPVIFPSTPEQMQAIVGRARKHQIPLRVRASGHTFNGVSLPQKGELLLRPDRFDGFRFSEEGTVTASCGALVWDVRDLVRDYGFDLPVYNGGWAGPTLGGYISAGGFGKGGLSHDYGGLWENVREITLIDGEGSLRTIARQDREFPWIFGSYGQLGFLMEAKLKLIPKEKGETPPYPLGASGKIVKRQTDDPKENDRPPQNGKQNRLFWFSLLVSQKELMKAWIDLYKFVKAHPHEIIPEGGWAGPVFKGAPMGYYYFIRFFQFNPPLVYPQAEPFLVIGVMSRMCTGDRASNQRTLQVEKAFIDLAKKGGYNLYPQAENFGKNQDFCRYYGEEIYNAFLQLKRQFDPDMIFNPGVVFDRVACAQRNRPSVRNN
ncbi:MAG: FAD-binding oxidoreductase [Hormoscilla sp. GM7CHS1pb]|nr:FAD-binding oxidoreductase [Hormoscilla sp. GM7CHS1pb]